MPTPPSLAGLSHCTVTVKFVRRYCETEYLGCWGGEGGAGEGGN